ncbi:hypothetical protein [Metabacillus niabensis]|uniref:hypothetical protein n=1 Tax=Metabacillus niabensis TaxID=324854 RepID=UPI001CF9F295|nr:hypothetical protein [Metabacillus niabensis]
MRHRLLFKSLFLLLIFITSIHLVSMSQVHHPISLGKVIAVENEAATGYTLLEEDQKHFDLYGILPEIAYTVLIAIALLLYSYFTTWNQRIRQFLYAVYFQSSYFSKDRLYQSS